MRPFRRPVWDAAWARHVLVDVVYDELGRYCAACERPLTVGAFLHDPGSGRLLGGNADEASFAALLPLCDWCSAATGGAPAPDGVLLPDRDTTFTLDDSSPLRYERRVLDVDGAPTEVVVVVGATDAGRATVAHFGLNTQFAVGDGSAGPVALRFPPGAGLLAPDPRLDLRTRAWDLAVTLLPLLGDPDPTLRAGMISPARIALRHSGFWSVWATVIGAALPGSDLLARLLLPPARSSAATRAAAAGFAAHATTGGADRLVGLAGDFPGTRTDWLPPAWLPGLLPAGAP